MTFREWLIKYLGGYTENEYNIKCFEVMLAGQCIIETAKLYSDKQTFTDDL